MKRLALALAVLGVVSPAQAREPLGVFEDWGAFRDARPPRCFAIAEPEVRRRNPPWRAFASVAHWPALHQRNQLHIRLSRERAPGSRVTLIVGDRRFALVGGGADAWAPDARTDAAIVAAMRSGGRMYVHGRAKGGGRFSDVYRLRGAATAIDAATIGCARR